MSHSDYMYKAICEAKKCQTDVPVGAVIFKDNKIISVGTNTREKDKKITGHAEICAINSACEKLGSWHLEDCDIYVTLEPCPMCAGAIKAARIRNVYFGAFNQTDGAALSVYNLLYPDVTVYPSILQEECSKLLTDFFDNLRITNS